MKNFLNKIYLILTVDCEQSAKLTSDSLDRDLDWSEYLATKLHRLICAKSRRLDRQLVQMHNALATNQLNQETLPDMPLSVKERIRKKVKQIQSGDKDGPSSPGSQIE